VRSNTRPLVAALLAFVYPGLGHLYLRAWLRAAAWFGAVIAATTLLVPTAAVPRQFSVESVLAAAAAMPPGAVVAVFALTLLSVVDAYWIASRTERVAAGADAEATPQCPSCGRDLDPDLEFCHWCTARFGEDA
jgi:hypothetical protein